MQKLEIPFSGKTTHVFFFFFFFFFGLIQLLRMYLHLLNIFLTRSKVKRIIHSHKRGSRSAIIYRRSHCHTHHRQSYWWIIHIVLYTMYCNCENISKVSWYKEEENKLQRLWKLFIHVVHFETSEDSNYIAIFNRHYKSRSYLHWSIFRRWQTLWQRFGDFLHKKQTNKPLYWY